jgi:hypothetical protein
MLFGELWPALVPLALYGLWRLLTRNRRVEGDTVIEVSTTKPFLYTPWGVVVVASLLIAIVTVLFKGLTEKPVLGEYQPAHMENGRLVDGGVRP